MLQSVNGLLPPMRCLSAYNIRHFSSKVPKYILNAPVSTVSTLPNGIRVVTEPTATGGATVGVWIEAGSMFETEKNNGTAHFFEHLAFRGTKKRSRRKLELEVENIGTQLHAYTSRDQTAYFARTNGTTIPQAIEILSDVLQNPTLSELSIAEERDTILRELREVSSLPEEVALDRLHDVAFKGTSMSRTILGPPNNIIAISRNDLTQYIKDHYRSDRMVIAAAGPVEHKKIVQLAQELFSGVHPSDSKRELPKVSYSGGMCCGESPVVLDTNPFATRVGVIIQLVKLTFARGPSCASCPRNSGNKNE